MRAVFINPGHGRKILNTEDVDVVVAHEEQGFALAVYVQDGEDENEVIDWHVEELAVKRHKRFHSERLTMEPTR